MIDRRAFLLASVASALAVPAFAEVSRPTLSPMQSRVFRNWMLRIIGTQITQGPSPRWQHRDCAGLVRFAVAETLRTHDEKWRRASGLGPAPLPPELALDTTQQSLRHAWRLADGTTAAYVGALEMIQENTRLVSRDCNLAAPADLLFFDQGDAQHVMVWMGHSIAYHTGSESPTDNGLRAVRLADLARWPDTRWHPSPTNPNFAGVYRFAFLTA